MSKFVDKQMKKRGYNKIEEGYYGAHYEKEEKEIAETFIHAVGVLHKASGNHIMQSYDKKCLFVDGKILNEVCGVEIPVLILMWLKAKWLSAKYGWGKKV